jgi:hypothetical protein
MKNLLDIKAFAAAFTLSIMLLALVFMGSRELQNFDPALIAYLTGTLFAFFGIVYRYAVWIQRPPSRMYFKRSLQFFFSGKILYYMIYSAREFIQNIAFQKFIYPRESKRWLAHFMLASGCTLAFAITIPLTFGWIHFTLKPESGLAPQAVNIYTAHFFGFEVLDFPIGSFVAFMTFHALNWCSLLVILGCAFFLRKRLTHAGQIATQTFEGDILPLLLLIIVSATGMALTLDYEFMKGMAYDFMAVTHAVSVILFLIWIPFGKFFHIIQRPAQIGAHIYKKEGMKTGMAVCPETGKEYATNLHIRDLKSVTKELGFNFENEEKKSLLDYSPEGKRDLLAKAHLKARQENGKLFG